MVLILVHLADARHERQNLPRDKLLRVHPQLGQVAGPTLGMHRAGRHRPGLVDRPHGPLIVVGDHHAADRLGGMRRPPADDVAAFAALAKDVPDRLRLPREHGDGTNAALQVGLGEAENAVAERPLARGNRGPDHRRELRIERGEVADHALIHQPLEMGHLARVHQRIDDLPIGRVPADQKDLLRRGVLIVSSRWSLRSGFAPCEEGCAGGRGEAGGQHGQRARLRRFHGLPGLY